MLKHLSTKCELCRPDRHLPIQCFDFAADVETLSTKCELCRPDRHHPIQCFRFWLTSSLVDCQLPVDCFQLAVDKTSGRGSCPYRNCLKNRVRFLTRLLAV